MIPIVPGMLALAALHVSLVSLRNWPRVMCGVALTSCALPLLLPTSAPLWRFAAAIFSSTLVFKTLLFAGSHVKLRSRFDFLLFLISWMPIVRWETPLRPDLRRAACTFLTALFQLGLAWLLVVVVPRLDAHHPVQLFTSPIGLYLIAAGVCNLGQVKLSLRGLDYDDGFNNPFGSLTPGEFWARRWNLPVSHLLHRYVFLPVGGRRHPVRGVMASFAASGAFHELLFDLSTLKFNGGMLAYFTLQGGLVAVTSRSRFVRRLVRDVPVLAWFLTTVVMLVTGILFVRGMDGVDPSNAWRRVFGPS